MARMDLATTRQSWTSSTVGQSSMRQVRERARGEICEKRAHPACSDAFKRTRAWSAEQSEVIQQLQTLNDQSSTISRVATLILNGSAFLVCGSAL